MLDAEDDDRPTEHLPRLAEELDVRLEHVQQQRNVEGQVELLLVDKLKPKVEGGRQTETESGGRSTN